MTFREYGEVKPMTITRYTPKGLDEAIEIIGRRFDIIDLQFSTAVRPIGQVEYSALALVRKLPKTKAKAAKQMKGND